MGYALAKNYLSGSIFANESVRRGESSYGGDDFVPTVYWIGRIMDEHDAPRELRQQLRIDVTKDPDDGNFIAFCPFAACGGVGTTPEGALSDLGLEILRTRDELEATDNNDLAEDAIELKNRLRRALP